MKHMKLFDITLRGGPAGAEEMFFEGAAGLRACGLAVRAGKRVSFERCFNLLPFADYSEYCGADNFSLSLDAKGEYELSIYVREKSGKAELVKTVQGNGKTETMLNFSGFGHGGYAYFTFNALGNCTINGGSWNIDKEIERDVKIGLVICTYHREEFVASGLKRISDAIASDPVWAERMHVFVVDNAKTLPAGEDGCHTIIHSKNLGGSGGFTRGIIEVHSRPEFTHFLLMDDDVVFEFSVIARTWYLLSLLSEKYKDASIGGSMLILEQPFMQYEYGGTFNGLNFKVINSRLDMRLAKNLLKNQNAAKPDYVGWWYCCMPVSAVDEYGLPMPFFIKGDDVEYAMRAVKQWIRMSGIAVWHQDFAGKYTGTLEYYIKRNLAIATALRCDSCSFKVALRFVYFMLKNLLLKNYECTEVLRKAYLDFKEGPAFFLREDPENVNRQLKNYDTPFSSAEKIEKLCNGKPEIRNKTMGKRKDAFRSLFLSIENYMPKAFFSKRVGVTDAGNPKASDCFMKRVVVHYDEKSGRGLIYSLDTKRRRKLRRASYKTFLGLLFGFGKIKKKYKAYEKVLCSRENWDRLFNEDTQPAK